MGESRRVPAFYPDYTDPDTWKRWDGSIEAEAWADLLEMRDGILTYAVASAAEALDAVGEDTGKRVDLEGLSAALWSISLRRSLRSPARIEWRQRDRTRTSERGCMTTSTNGRSPRVALYERWWSPHVQMRLLLEKENA